MSDSLSPPPEDHELELPPGEEVALDDEEDDEGISTDTSGSLPGSPGVDEDPDVVTVCKWDECGQDLQTLDALVRHVHDCKSDFFRIDTNLAAVQFTSVPDDLDIRANGRTVFGEVLLKPLDSLLWPTYVHTRERNLSTAMSQVRYLVDDLNTIFCSRTLD